MSGLNITLSVRTVNDKTIPAVTSRQVAEAFGKEHKNVLADIRNTIAKCSKSFTELNFQPSEYSDSTGRKLPCYLLSKDGLLMVTMGYITPEAMRVKEAYIKRFNEMEAELAHGPRVPDDPTELGLPDFRDPVKAAQAWALEAEGRREAEARLALAEPKAEVFDAVVADTEITLRDFCRRLDGVNLNRVKHSLCAAGVFYVGTDGAHRVYAKYRDTHFAEKFDKDFGTRTFLVLEEGKKLLTRLYNEDRLELRKGWPHAVREL